MLTKYTVKDNNLPESFDGLKIVQISDLHNNFYDDGNEKILETVKAQKPDLIAITGDYVDKNTKDIEPLIAFSKKLSKIADCYFITGNHEAQYCAKAGYKEFLSRLEEVGIKPLDDDCITINRGDDKINLAGLKDPLLKEIDDKKYTECSQVYKQSYTKLNPTGYTVLLVHRPYEFETLTEFKPNLILSGHEHGGQIRLPFIGGVFAPGEGFLPEYDRGIYKKDTTTMIVSAGLGNGEAPIRFNNRPEVVVIELKR